ncbi:shikimate dehydrogenase [Flavobacteriaceae bacterium]|nr:shikimate dehydrogenase [Flavobacteriaceae bacterium]
MEGKEKLNKELFGLVGKNISYSFSKGYFSDKFRNLQLINHEYVNFDIDKIEDLLSLVNQFKASLKGFNVTIPYKQSIFNYLDEVDATANEIGAVNTVKLTNNGKLIGYNSDVVGFEKSILPLLKKHHTKALILGTGGASNAVGFVLKKQKIDFYKVSRNPTGNREISYSEISEKLLKEHMIIINSSPLGTFPNIDQKPSIPYQFLTKKHLLFDLIYNPAETAFLMEGKKQGAQIKNGFEMLELQAEESWRIWNK